MINLPDTAERVSQNTAPEVNDRIRQAADERVMTMERTDEETIRYRIAELEQEWDVERLLQVNAPTIVLASLLIGHTLERRARLFPFVIFGFLLQHSLQGWCPPLPAFRRAGKRTVREIERERTALKALLGDFDDVTRAPDRVRAALVAVDR